ncbi:collagenase-like [Leptidea sinapis]|uniref:collagenase-like n=1 Tax=Leptidea sinapis TaxID=189913 RepID=UPI00212161A8|nr:collagenase-like [Leptidea sinapis]
MVVKHFLLLALTVAAVFSEELATYPENVRENQGRIVSGWEAYPGQFPYQLSLRMVSPAGVVFACGATVIHNEWALTAAHCTAARVTILIRAGATDLSNPELVLETTEYYNHPNYIEQLTSVQPDDIGLIKFPIAIEYSQRIQPIRLQSSQDRNKNYDRMRFTATGWGRTWTGGSSPQVMNWVYLLGVTNFNCLLAFNFSPIIVDSTICASFFNVTSQSTCQGDSGGGLTVEDIDGQPTQVGVSSFVSSGGCHTEVPAGFIRPGHYHEWYTEVTGINFDWIPGQTTEAPETETTTVTQEDTTVTESETTVTEAVTTVTEAKTTVNEAATTVTDIETTVSEAQDATESDE